MGIDLGEIPRPTVKSGIKKIGNYESYFDGFNMSDRVPLKEYDEAFLLPCQRR
ncbi:hypothetical protein FD35_GL000178 [Furfurilactobacillus rossiae DSM 15814]|uniref:Uncharacterized protein n=1 Tax=Furfurilactobacillus rossiae DSM 15814 TaxID=1114972 RepID=A0A0R1RVD5_9LACO|nr:hypothetical protein FD35_GL000178 [Furfurilactobacillus rossiae DSM 15814]